MNGPDGRTILFQKRLFTWYAVNGRAYPWRGEVNPYRVLIAERMLHRTRADQVVPTYRDFIGRYPNARALAAADPVAVRKQLGSLGLAWRFASFVPMAQRIMEDYDGRVPQEREELLTLPGVGPYAADAVLCFAFHQPIAVVDTNTIRVAGRYLMGAPWVSDDRKRIAVRAAVTGLLDVHDPVAANYAMLDLGAVVCVARSPHCYRCPVIEGCVYGSQRPHYNPSAGTHRTHLSSHDPGVLEQTHGGMR